MAGRGLGRSLTLTDPARDNFKITNNRGEQNDRNAPRSRSRSRSGSGSVSIREAGNGTISWKAFKNRIRLHRTGHAFLPDSDKPNPNTVPEFNPNPMPGTNREAGSGGGGEPVMSLMALLEQTEGGGFGSFEDPDAGLDDDGEEGGEYACCVCMVRHKGAGFIPCAHTFCRLCSRELWVSQGNCPLCNGFILEILDIF